MKKQILILLFTAWFVNSNAQLTITSNQTYTQLTNAITGGGVVVSNITGKGPASSQGLFTCTGACNVGLSSGIILTSGDALIAAQANTNTGQGAWFPVSTGDPQLQSITTGPVFDASMIEFDFIAASDSIQFNYIFASEEYNDYANASYNDVFGFFITGPGFTGYQNIALVPGTTIPMSINNVNNGGPVPHGFAPTGPCMNCQYFVNNSPGNITTAYDALTTVMVAAIGGLTPGLIYHLKIGVSDCNDPIFDSGVFLEAGSFLSANPAWMYAGGERITGNQLEICAGGQVELSAPFGFSYLWSDGSTTQSIIVSQPGQYSVTLTGSNQQATVSSDIVFVVTSATSLNPPVINQNGNQLTSSVVQPGMSYSWTMNGTPVTGANGSSITITQNGCYTVTVKDASGCLSSSNPLCTGPLGIAENSHYAGFGISPNPTSGSAWITLPASDKSYQLQLTDMQGRMVLNDLSVRGEKYELKSAGLSNGVYIGEINHPEKGSYRFRLMKDK